MSKIKVIFDKILFWGFIALLIVAVLLTIGTVYYLEHLRFCR